MTDILIAKRSFPVAGSSAVASRSDEEIADRKRIRASRKKIVDSAPLRVYVHVTLPNCGCGDADGLISGGPDVLPPMPRSSLMAATDKSRRAKARRLYEHEHLPVAAIAAQCEVTRATVLRWARTDTWTRDDLASAPDAPVDRRALVTRAWRNAERQLRLVEKRMRTHGPDDPPLDESARLIATLVKTLRELAALDRTLAEDMQHHGGTGAEGAGHDIPRDLDAFYEELAARMDRLRQHRDGGGIAGDAAAGAD